MMRGALVLLLLGLASSCEYSLSGCDGSVCVSSQQGEIDTDCEREPGCASSCPAASTLNASMLREVSLARRLFLSCPAVESPTVVGMTLDATLDEAATVHAGDMAEYDFEAVTGSDGLGVHERVEATAAAGYGLDEHLAQLVLSGASDAEEAVNHWLDNPAHCAVLLSDLYSHLGAACAEGDELTRWSLVLGGH